MTRRTDDVGFREISEVALLGGVGCLVLRVRDDQPVAMLRRGQILRDAVYARETDTIPRVGVTRWISLVVMSNDPSGAEGRLVAMQPL